MAPSSKKFKTSDGSAKMKPPAVPDPSYQPAIEKPASRRTENKGVGKNIDKLRAKILRKNKQGSMPPPRDVKPRYDDLGNYQTPDIDTPHDNYFEPEPVGHLEKV